MATIQAGIDAAFAVETVLVADGTYSGRGNVNLDFGGVDLELRSSGGSENCAIDGEEQDRLFYFHSGESANFHSGESADALVEGISIINGFVDEDDPENQTGGAVYIESSDATFRGCRFENNTSSEMIFGFPNENAESFHSRLRDELLDRESFMDLREARALSGMWQNAYNHRRPHSSLGYQTPAAYAAQCMVATHEPNLGGSAPKPPASKPLGKAPEEEDRKELKTGPTLIATGT
jgi:hypothetical protein